MSTAVPRTEPSTRYKALAGTGCFFSGQGFSTSHTRTHFTQQTIDKQTPAHKYNSQTEQTVTVVGIEVEEKAASGMAVGEWNFFSCDGLSATFTKRVDITK